MKAGEKLVMSESIATSNSKRDCPIRHYFTSKRSVNVSVACHSRKEPKWMCLL